jgi:outer membrane protein OmpA-like peptidoglycan-associated protein
MLLTSITFHLNAQSGVLNDELTIDPEQNKSWKMGESNYSAKPKNAWELGIHAGHYMISGDVNSNIPAGFGLGLHLRKAIHYSFSIRGDLFYGRTSGLEPQPYSARGDRSSLLETAYNPLRASGDGIWFPAYRTTQIYGGIQGILNIGNILFHKPNNKWNIYLALGVALSTNDTKLDLLSENGSVYSNLISTTGFTQQKFDTKDGRKEIKDALRNVYDGDYETDGPRTAGIFRIGDATNNGMVTGSLGISRKINNKVNIGLEHQFMATGNDYLDGVKFLNTYSTTQSLDVSQYTNIRFGINLGNSNDVTEPLYWMNPLDASMSDIAALKQRPILDLTDSDGDGIIDMLDQEKDSPRGARVDTRGVTLDSDADGVADHLDKEPYSPPGYKVDDSGIAIGARLTEDDVNRLIDAKLTQWSADSKGTGGCGNWFLPMIHFDLNSSRLKPEFYGQLHHIATVMKMCPNTCVTVVGHTDVRSSNQYNQGLSYKRAQSSIDYLVSNYGIDRSRLKLMYDGEETNLIKGSRMENQHYMNRRVEFRVCESSDTEMEAPEGMAARSNTRSGSSSLRGAKDSGF